MKKVVVNLNVKDEEEARKVAERMLEWWEAKNSPQARGDEIEINLDQLYPKED